jgi:hypothetical protein
MPLKIRELKRAYTEPISRANTVALAAMFIAVVAVVFALGAYRHAS